MLVSGHTVQTLEHFIPDDLQSAGVGVHVG
jgi:hypothetical protein